MALRLPSDLHVKQPDPSSAGLVAVVVAIGLVQPDKM